VSRYNIERILDSSWMMGSDGVCWYWFRDHWTGYLLCDDCYDDVIDALLPITGGTVWADVKLNSVVKGSKDDPGYMVATV
jgi:hypothetical protein